MNANRVEKRPLCPFQRLTSSGQMFKDLAVKTVIFLSRLASCERLNDAKDLFFSARTLGWSFL